RVRFASTKSYEGADITTRASLPEDAVRTSVRFEPPLELVDLERESIPMSVALRIDRPLSAAPAIPTSRAQGAGAPNPPEPATAMADSARREGLHVVIENERHAVIADETTGGDGRARFELPTSALGAAGSGELRARFAGAPGLAPSEDVQPIVRRALVAI